MPVRELMRTHTARDIAEWQAYDLMYGLTDPYVSDVLADIHEAVQFVSHVVAAQYGEEGDDNPVPPPTRYPRPAERRRPFSFELDDDE